ncbi:MAG: hypothetical protein HUJ25_02320 [Crocinitomicaceae bacterium]|nr:hypothetical protein [Crocinitomicaceae bacterium]
MKYFYFLFILAILSSCNDNGNESESDSVVSTESPDTSSTNVAPNSEQSDPSKTVEYFPNGQVKMEGKINENGNREGLWIAYYETGVKWSESYYIDGKRDGHSLSFYPNGQVRYVGEYKNDIKVGTWTFYDEEGNLVNEETF